MRIPDIYRWSECAPMPLALSGCAVAPWRERLLVAGGTSWRGGKKVWSGRVDAFDPSTDRWDPLPALPRPQGDAACLVLEDAVVILGGGSNDSSETTAWSFRGKEWRDEPDLALPAPRKSLAAAIVAGTAYVIGGFENARDKNSASRLVWARDPASKRWEPRSPLPEFARFNPAVAVIDGRIFAAGGAVMDAGRIRNLDDVICYDPASDRWSEAGRLPVANRAGSGIARDGKLILLGGFTDDFERRIFRFDPATGRTEPAGLLPHPLADSRFALVQGRLYGVGGETGSKIRAPWTLEAAG